MGLNASSVEGDCPCGRRADPGLNTSDLMDRTDGASVDQVGSDNAATPPDAEERLAVYDPN